MQLKTLILESRGLLSSENRLFAQINEDDISIFSLDLLIFFEEHRTYLYIEAGLASPDKWGKKGT
jgi:hypothetical protein